MFSTLERNVLGKLILLVIPAQAGIQFDLPSTKSRATWTPAFAGVTDTVVNQMFSSFPVREMACRVWNALFIVTNAVRRDLAIAGATWAPGTLKTNTPLARATTCREM